VGSGANADFILENETVSRTHVELELVPEGIRVRDLGSRNGVYYGGHQVKDITLSASAVLRLGNAELSLTFDTASLATAGERESYGRLVGQSVAIRKLFGVLRRVEGSLINVLLVGESGTGKELIARAIHEHSAVSTGQLVTVNCGALNRELVRSELFGHRRGAFTGATEHRSGAFQDAHGGTLFLDEVGELPLEVQPFLLRALQENEVVRVGETRPEKVKVRLIAATHRDLRQMVTDGEFREDLFYRLNVIRIEVPALRTRPEDIPPLSLLAAKRAGLESLPPGVLEQLCAHSWPGNVRELMHAVEVYAAVGELPLLQKQPTQALEKLLLQHIDASIPYETLKRDFLARFLVAYLQQLLAQTGGNVSSAARISGLDRSYLNKLVIQHGLR
jgi:two-component system, NtrC family, response regulator GlrR